ncbi:MAG: glycosyltransferase [Desulfobacterium sp.]|nr:glycosyltransferase [Desulfobacterium sp.]
MDVSVIIPTYNNCNRLNITLEAFTKLETLSDILWELIVVNNNSNDSTKEVVCSFTDKLRIKYVEELEQGISIAKNTGLRNSSGELIIFTDDDVKPCKNWIQLYWQEYQRNPKGYFFGGPIVSDFEVTPLDMDLIRLGPASVKGLNYGKIKKELETDEFFVSANWAAPSEVVKEIGGFNTEMGLNASTDKVSVGEETDLMERLISKGLTPFYLPEASIKHFVPKSKMTLEHIASRTEASGRYLVDKELEITSGYFFGVPRWIYRQLFEYWLKIQIKKLFFKSWYKDYLAYRHLLGCRKQIINSNQIKKMH